MSRNSPKILAIIPCHNEAESIGALLNECKNLPFHMDTLVIDDGSHDETYTIALQYSEIIKLKKNKGLAYSIKVGIKYALENNYDYCIQIDGDGQHIPSEIHNFFPLLTAATSNIMVGSRYFKMTFRRICRPRAFAGLIISLQIFALWGKWLYDPLSGMRMLDRKAMHLMLASESLALDAQIIPIALQSQLSVSEIPVHMRPRITGESYVKGLYGVHFLLYLMWQIFKTKRTNSANILN